MHLPSVERATVMLDRDNAVRGEPLSPPHSQHALTLPYPARQCVCLKAESYRFALPEDAASVALPHTKKVLDKVCAAFRLEGVNASPSG